MSDNRLYRETDSSRWVVEEKGPRYRSPFRRDYARLLHSPAFRRLQGKTQLFPGFESDFFRNRLTHSLEVAQIAKSIALRLNDGIPEFMENPINLDIVEFAGLAHDLGHPPFGHNGETALDKCMKPYGGFEGNAQTLRILARLEKKIFQGEPDSEAKGVGVSKKGVDHRAGLNLTARSLAAILKYDRCIPIVRDTGDPLVKGYYSQEKELADWIRAKVLGHGGAERTLKTIECQIMDLADDIAYSTYDLEDTFKAGFQTPLGLLSLSAADSLRDEVAERVSKAIERPFSASNVLEILLEIFDDLDNDPIVAYRTSVGAADNGYMRNALTSQLVNEAVDAVQVEFDREHPALSKIGLEEDVFHRVETLKHLTFCSITRSPRLKVAEFRGLEIITTIFEALADGNGYLLIPGDYQELYRRFSGDSIARHRLICDFIAGMTDTYAIEFYARLKSENARTIFKPF